MTEWPNEIKTILESDSIEFNKGLDELRQKAIIAKKQFLSEPFDSWPDDGEIDAKIRFVNQFDDLILDLVLFPDNEVLDKLNSLKFSNKTLQWFVPIDDIIDEINKLKQIDGFFFLKSHYLFAITAHLKVKVFVSLIEGFGLNILYNNIATNIAYKDFAERFRRREYNKDKLPTPQKEYFERILNIFYDFFEIIVDDNGLAKKYILKPFRGDSSIYFSMLDCFYCEGISRRKIYSDLFPLLKMIMKDVSLLSEDEYLKTKDQYYDALYSVYKIARVKKILLKK